jgi:hypothetical protein
LAILLFTELCSDFLSIIASKNLNKEGNMVITVGIRYNPLYEFIYIMSKKMAFIAACSVAMSSVACAAPQAKLKVGGRMDTMYLLNKQKDAYAYAVDENTAEIQYNSPLAKHGLIMDTSVEITADFNAGDLSYGASIILNADTSPSTTGEESVADRTKIYIKHDKIGMLEIGATPGAGGRFEMMDAQVAHAAYGVWGFWSQTVSSNEDLALGATVFNKGKQVGWKYLFYPSLPSNYSGQHYSDANKASFYTKPTECLTMGISYIPNLDHTGTTANFATTNGGPGDAERAGNRSSFKDIVSGGLSYEYKFADDAAVTLYAAGEIGKAKSWLGGDLLRDLRAYEVGVYSMYKGFKFSGSYGDWGKTGTYKKEYATPGAKQGANYWTLGMGQQIDKFGYSLSYFDSRRAGGQEAVATSAFPTAPVPTVSDAKYNKLRAVSLGVDYKLADGLLPYLEITEFRFKNGNAFTTRANKGRVFLAGIRVSF